MTLQPFLPRLVLNCPSWASKVRPFPLLNIVFQTLLLSTISSFPCTVRCRIVFAKPEDFEICPDHLSFRFLTKIRSSSYFPMAAWIFLRTSSLVTWCLYETFTSLRQHFISKACILFSTSDAKTHDSQAYTNKDMPREHISFTSDPRDMLLSLHTGFSFIKAAVACAILERTSGFEPSSDTIAPRYLKLVTVPSFCLVTLISLLMPLALFVISFVFSAIISILYLVKFCWYFQLEPLVLALLQQEHRPQIGNGSSAYANLSIMFFQSIRHNPFEKNLEKGGWEKTSLPDSNCCSEPFFCAAIHIDCTNSIAVQVLKGAN